MKPLIRIAIVLAAAASSVQAQSPMTSRPSAMGTIQPMTPTSFPKNSSTGPSFRPTPSEEMPSLRQASKGLNTVLDASRATGYGGLLGIEGAGPIVIDNSASIQRLRSSQSARSRQRMALNRPTSTGAKHQVSHVLVPNFEPPASPAEPAVSWPTRTAVLKTRLKLGSLAVDMKGRTAVVTGAAPNADRVDLVTKYLLLEPGVDSVDNQMTVEKSP